MIKSGICDTGDRRKKIDHPVSTLAEDAHKHFSLIFGIDVRVGDMNLQIEFEYKSVTDGQQSLMVPNPKVLDLCEINPIQHDGSATPYNQMVSSTNAAIDRCAYCRKTGVDKVNKVMEGIIDSAIKQHLLTNNLPSNTQF
eukprot:g40024.t1